MSNTENIQGRDSYFKRIVLVVLDGFGVGEQEDAARFGDQGANTLLSVFQAKPNVHLPNLNSLGLLQLSGPSTPQTQSIGLHGKMREISAGKDTTTGHWEMMGLPVQKSFDFFPEGFPEEIMNDFVSENGLTGYLGNRAASGTEIIKELGEEHCLTGKPIVYTSADSVFQIAAHEEIFGLQKLYDLCRWTREYFNRSGRILGRVIARPFVGSSPIDFKRTTNRKDFSLKPFGETTLSRLTGAGIQVVGFGKIPSIYDYVGISKQVKTGYDENGIQELIAVLKSNPQPGLYFLNLNDLDTLYGHRRNARGYAEQLENIDARLPDIFSALKSDDLLLITSDHGNDPGFRGTDHTREFVPLFAYSKKLKTSNEPNNSSLGIRNSFCDVGASILDNFELPFLSHGSSFLKELKRHG